MKSDWMTGLVVIACGLVNPLAVSAQMWGGQVPGERIRVTLADRKIEGVIAESKPGELVLTDSGGASWPLAHDEIQRLERSLGVQRQ